MIVIFKKSERIGKNGRKLKKTLKYILHILGVFLDKAKRQLTLPVLSSWLLLGYVWLQCVQASDVCDLKEQCVDGSDEHRCPLLQLKETNSKKFPVMINFQQSGDITKTHLRPDRNDSDVSCPDTHFWCPEKDYCLPVFVRCNGVYDCPGHEDEAGCDLYTCPGFYRCRASKVCVHVTSVCDGWPMCPHRDDELSCGQQCPQQCICHGLAFFCPQMFAAHQFPDLRYLDARESGINVHQLGHNHMLIHLSLARCGVNIVSNFTFHNLHSLDLSDNQLREASGHHFRQLPQLTVLFLAGNPLISVFEVPVTSNTELHKTITLDLSRVIIPSLDPDLFHVFPNLHTLNLSKSGVEFLNSLQVPLTSLQELDLRGCPIVEFPRDVLRGFFHLKILFADNFKLCCPSVLPSAFDLSDCHATPDDVSSCDDLLGSVTYRATVAVLATLAMVGNVVSLALRVCVHSTWRLSSGSVILTHLSVADLGMGLYLTTLGLADRLLAGQYVWHDNTWRKGAVCHVAGGLALSCRLAATLFTLILTLHRSLYHYPVFVRCLTTTKLKVLCVAIWATSLLLAAVLLLSQWRFFEQQALCILLPHKQNDSVEFSYIYAVLVLLTAMFVLCCIFEVISAVIGRVAKHTTINKNNRPSEYSFVVLGSITCGFLYTIACLVPTDSQTDRQKAIHTALVYFGSVISSAINPYLHLYGVRVQLSKRIKEERLLMIINRVRV